MTRALVLERHTALSVLFPLLLIYAAACGKDADNFVSDNTAFTSSALEVAGLGPTAVDLGSTTDLAAAGSYALLAKSGITNVTGSSISGGNLGVSPIAATAITGFALIMDPSNVFSTSASVVPPAKVYAANYAVPTPSNLTQAVLKMQAAYTDAAGRSLPDFINLGSGNIGGMTLVPGLYTWGTTVTIPADVTINGGPNDVWIFQISNNLDLSTAKKVILSGGAQARNIFWQVAGQATIRVNAHFEGIILSKTGITLQTNASLHGRALAQTLIALDNNVVITDDSSSCSATIYEAETMFHSVGVAITDGWSIRSNGYISAQHPFAAGSTTLTVYAKGQVANRVWPHMVVSVGGVTIGSTSVSATSWKPYSFSFIATAGTKEIRVIYDNDATILFQDRNLLVDKVVVSCPGSSGTGGSPGTGGASGSGGAVGTGGAIGTGGRIGTGGAIGTGGSAIPVTYEAEVLARTSSAVGTCLSNDSKASGGVYVELKGKACVGDWIEFTIPSLAAATYDVKMYYKSNNNRGIIQASIDGVSQGSPCNEYAAAPGFRVLCGLGSKSLAAGSHRFRFTVTGKTGASSGYTMTVDSIVLTATGGR